MTANQSSKASPESECRYRALREAIADYHYHVEVQDGRIVKKIHGANCDVITGYTAQEYASDPQLWIRIVHEQDRATTERQIAEFFADQVVGTIEYRIRRKDGQIRWIRKTIIPYHDDDGLLIAYDGLLSDVTELKQAEEDLRQSEERFRLIFEDDLTGNYLASADGTILLCNQAFVEIFGFNSTQDAVGSKLANLYGDPVPWPGFIELLTQNKVLDRYERAGRHSDGTVRHVVESVLGTFDAEGCLVRIKGYVFDDTDSKIQAAHLNRRNAELEEIVAQRSRALREKHEHLQAIWNSAFDAIITIDGRGIIESANRAAELMFGYSAAEFIGRNVAVLMPTPYRENHDAYLQRFHETGEPRILNSPRELLAKRKDGSTFPIDLSVTQVDHSECFTGIIRDISDRKLLQRHILEISSEEQRRIGRELHDGTGQELTGLSLIAGTLLDLVEAAPEVNLDGQTVRQIDEPAFLRICGTIRKLNQKLADTNRHVHQLSHGIMPVQIDAEALQSSLTELAVSTNMPPTVSCRFNCPQPVRISNNTTATHLYRIAQEAVNNALRHSQANEICITLRQSDDELILEVSDDGIGIDEVYSRVAAAREDHGMGLRTMQYRAGMLGGTLQIQRRETGGTQVRCSVLVGVT
jgi:PAS domain S-box-containing protein